MSRLPSPDTQALLDALPEAALITSASGVILGLNRPARHQLGGAVAESNLLDHLDGDGPEVQRFIQRCLGSSAPLVGAIIRSDPSGAVRLKCRGNRIALPDGPGVLLRILDSNEDQFGALSRKVLELNAEITQRKRAEAILQETLRERELLLRELQHRVKNNMQMLAGMLLGSAREATSAEAQIALRDAANRFSAVSAVQQLLYGSGRLDAIGSEALVSSLLAGLAGMTRGSLRTSTHVDPVDLPIEQATPISLVLNELLVNALKYGVPAEADQHIAVEFRHDAGDVLLIIQDNGPGIADAAASRRASGLGLVRALLRQLGGQLEIEYRNGARCVARFALPIHRMSDDR
jgi:two-component sensor histidine kinase